MNFALCRPAMLLSPLAVLGAASVLHVAAATMTQVVDGRSFTLPEGFTISRVSTTNQVLRPVNASLDDRGRLYLTDSSGSSEDPKAQAKDPQWRVVRLEDSDGDGTYDRSVVVADHLPMLQGILWHPSGLYIGGTPSIWKLGSFDAEGRAGSRTEWWNVGQPSTHCGNEVHGPYDGPDGYIYWTKGAFEPISWTNSLTGKVYRDRAAHIFRAKPDGSEMESLMSGGMDNPVEVAFTPRGELLFTSTFIDFTQPGFRDGLGHATYGSVFGKENSNVEDPAVKRTGPDLMQPIAQLGAAAPSGLTRYPGMQFGAGYRDNFFASLFNLRKISRHILTPAGGTFTAETSDFVATDDLDFHPTDVLTDSDGTLLIVDTGGWYKLCCPSSQLWKPDVLGAVYRVRKTGAAHPRLAAGPMSVSDPTSPSISAREIARKRDASAVPGLLARLRTSTDAATASIVTAALTELGAAAPLRQALQDPVPGIQRAALTALAEMDGSDLKSGEVVGFLKSGDAALKATAQWIIQRRTEWSAELAGWFRSEVLGSEPAATLPLLPILTGSPAGQKLLGELAVSESTAIREAAMAAIAGAGLKDVPADWWRAFRQNLGSNGARLEPQRVDSTVRHARGLSGNGAFGAQLAAALGAVGGNPAVAVPTRLDALALSAPGRALTAEEFSFLTPALSLTTPPVQRRAAAEGLSRAALTPSQLQSLLGSLKQSGPLEFGRLLAAYDRGGDEVLGSQLVQTIRQSSNAQTVVASQLVAHFAKFPESVQVAAKALATELAPDTARQSAHITSLLAELQGMPRSVRQGQAVFNSPKAACIACHQIGYQGGKVGPDLTRISDARSERDLLEAVVYPSASFVRSYEPQVISTKSGETVLGIIRRETDAELVIATGPGAEQRVAKSEITDRQPGTVSVMPAGLDTQLSKQELADLIAFLKNTKWGAQ